MRKIRWLGVAVSVLVLACDSSDSANETASRAPRGTSDSAGPFAPPTAAGNAAAAGKSASGDTGTPATGTRAPQMQVPMLAPEVEVTLDLQLPQASENYVYAVNPDAGTVAVIDARTQAIKTVKTGSRPTYLRTLDGSDDAIVLNVGSNTASVIRNRDDVPSKTDLAVSRGANAIALAPDSKHAIVYFNSTYAGAAQNAGSYQDVSVLTLSSDGSSDAALSMTVGFRPRDVFFADDGSRAFVVTEDGVSVLDFAELAKSGSGIARLISFGGAVDQQNLDVAVTPDGRYALARSEGQSMLHLVELQSGQLRSLDLAKLYTPPSAATDPAQDAGTDTPVTAPVEVTDLDLMPGGHKALAVLRNQSAVLEIPLPDAFDDLTSITTIEVPGQVIGSVTIGPDGAYALGYTTAADLERLTILDLAKHTPPRAIALRKSVQAVTFTPDGKTALITHKKAPGSPTDSGLTPDQVIDRSFGYSLLRVASGDVKLQVTRTQLGPIAMVPDASYLFILFRDDAQSIKEVQRVALSSFLVDPIIQLENPPISIGTARASGAVFVNLEHPDGRMTFIDWQQPTDKLRTVTGFELNSRIRD